VAVIRIAVPYTGMILSTRESPQMRDELLQVREASFFCLMFSGVRLWCVLLLRPAVLAVCSCLMLLSECVSTAAGRRTDAGAFREQHKHGSASCSDSVSCGCCTLQVGMSQMSAGSRTDVGAYDRNTYEQ
jgi:hypothetical protein